MTNTNERAVMGDNHPPHDPVDEAIAPFADAIEMAENTLIGVVVENDAQESDVDALAKDIKSALKAVADARLDITRPMDAAKKSVMDKFKPTETDLKRIAEELVKMVAPYKKAKAAKIVAAQAEADRKAKEALRVAQEARAASSPTDLDDRREADAMADEAQRLAKDAKKASKVKVARMRTVKKHEITDRSALARDIWIKDADAMNAFLDEYARKNAHNRKIDGVNAWVEEEPY